ncbi:MAG: glucosyltransferase domain-containing protein [Gemmiger sp.]|nr:glucosyltransferase domain-containing protein [Gemmiger sp.]
MPSPSITQNTVPAGAHQKAPAAQSGGAFWLFASFFRRPGLLLGLAALLMAGYGYAMAVPAVNMDDLALDVYFAGGEFLRQSRFTVWLLQRFTGIMAYQRLWPELFAAVCLALAGLLFGAVLYRAAAPGVRPATLPLLLLAGGLLVWPYHAELLVYANQCGMGLGYLLCAAALGLLLPLLGGWRGQGNTPGQQGVPATGAADKAGAAGKTGVWAMAARLLRLPCLLRLLAAAACLALALGCYESFAPVWLTMLFALLLVQAAAAPPGSIGPGQRLADLCLGLAPLALGLLLRGGATAALCALAGVTGGDGTASKTIFWFRRASLWEAVAIPLREWLDNYLALAFGVPALALLLCGAVALLCWLVAHRRHKNGVVGWGVLLLLSQYSLGLLQGTGSQMARAVQCFGVFVPFVAWLLLGDAGRQGRKSGGKARPLVCGGAAVLLLAEVFSLNDTFLADRTRWQYEQATLQGIGAALAALEPAGSLPVAFCGEITLGPQSPLEQRLALPAGNPAYKVQAVVAAVLGGPQGTLYRYENPGQLAINWAQTAFGSHEQLYRLWAAAGCSYPATAPTPAQQAEADALAEALPHWPEAGSVCLQAGYLLVNF